jgi:erythromycin esterase
MKARIELEHTEVVPLSNSKDLDPLMERIGNARVVLLGEASHGTHEYYTWRTAISKRLIEEKGFNFIAVEGDWPDCYRVNRYVKGFDYQHQKPDEVLSEFNRWPTWMWANWEIAALITWLKTHNSRKLPDRKAGFYGLDVYSLWESLETLMEYLNKTDRHSASIVEKALACFSGYGKNEQRYALNALNASCREQVVQLLREVRLRSPMYNNDPEAALNTTQNAYIAVEAERYYSNMISFDEQTWNIRDRHMMDTLERLMEFHGEASKAIVWEHNTHVGDARYTDMEAEGLFNLGQLARQRYPGEGTFIVGFCSYAGTVIAGDSWGAEMREQDVPPARKGSIEDILHHDSEQDRLFIFGPGSINSVFDRILPHRAIGVVYNPGREHGNYVPSHMNKRYDALIYLEQTRALHPLHIMPDPGQVPETYPFEY